MKNPEYVGFITKMYRELIDNQKTENNEKDLKKLFNRDFTEGHLFENKNQQLMNIKSPNHIGIEIGKIIQINKKIKIKLTEDLAQNDGIRFKESSKGLIINKLYNEKGLLINKAKKGEIIYLDNKLNIKTLDTILKTTDYNLLEKLKQYQKIKIPINFQVIAKENQKLQITISDNKNKIKEIGNNIEKSITHPITKENIIKQLSKTGNTPFKINNINIDMDPNIFISLKELNEIRRNLITKLIKERTKINRTINKTNIKKQINITNNNITINASIQTENQLKTLLNKVDKIYTDNYNLYKKYKNHNIYYKLDRTNYSPETFKNEKLLITELGGIYKYPNTNQCLTDYTLNVVNNHSINFLQKQNIKQITLSPELTLKQIKDLAKYNDNIEIIIYGTLELMIMNHCIIAMNDKCPNCKKDNYYLQNKQNEKFQIITKNCKTHIMQNKKVNLLNDIKELKKIGIKNYRIELFNEDEKETINILNKIKDNLK